jgi:hypothetical protein
MVFFLLLFSTKPGLQKGAWKEHEDEIVKKMVESFRDGKIKWSKIANEVDIILYHIIHIFFRVHRNSNSTCLQTPSQATWTYRKAMSRTLVQSSRSFNQKGDVEY